MYNEESRIKLQSARNIKNKNVIKTVFKKNKIFLKFPKMKKDSHDSTML